MTEQNVTRFVLKLSCPNRIGIVSAVSTFLLEMGCNITESAQYDDESTGQFFMRVEFTPTCDEVGLEQLENGLEQVAKTFLMDWSIHDTSVLQRVLILVSKFDHCLVDLLYRCSIGELNAEIVGIVSNHTDSQKTAEQYGIPFHYLPISQETKSEQEARLLDLARRTEANLIVLARYMQILSDRLCANLPCPAINIHHSFLPGFKGARPYHQAHARGVKIIGATAHYVTPDLDEGPIIEQDVKRVSHAHTPHELIAVGRDVERQVLAKAVKMELEHRILLNGSKTIVFD